MAETTTTTSLPPTDPTSEPTGPSTSSTTSTTSESTGTTSSTTSEETTISDETTSTTSELSGTTASTTPTPTLPPTTATSPTSSSTRVTVITSGNAEVTQTVVIQTSVATSPASTPTQTVESNSFFDNTGYVAGTFSAVGVVVLIAVIYLTTVYIRKRRARKFDREVDQAAMEAATAPAPTFLDDDDVYTSHNAPSTYTSPSSGNGYYGASDTGSHGTYNQPPIGHAESYGMSELNGGRSVGVGQLFNQPPDTYGMAATAGAAGIGVQRTRSTLGNPADPQSSQPQTPYSQQSQQPNYGLEQGGTPYAAFAYPHQQSHAPAGYDDNPYSAAAVGSSYPHSLQRGHSMTSSQGGSGQYDMSPPPPMPTVMHNPYDSQRGQGLSPPPIQQQQGQMPNPHEDTKQTRAASGADFGTGSAFGGSTPEFGHAPIHTAHEGEQGRWSDYQNDEDEVGVAYDRDSRGKGDDYDDDKEEEEEEKPKVFKVANA